MSSGYIVGTGWWCDGTGQHAGSQQAHVPSDSFIRGPDFFRFWHYFVDRYTDPDKIVIVDSASPVPPPMPDDPRIEFLSMAENFGHSITSEAMGVMSGVERCSLALAAYAYLNDRDLVYIEQDCLVRGEGWVDHCFESLHKGKIMYGDGVGTPQPMQQSVMLFKRDYLPRLIDRIIRAFNRHHRGRFFDPIARKRWGDCPERRWHYVCHRDADILPFEGGRTRPLDFSQRYLYAQHWSREELIEVMALEPSAPAELTELLVGGDGG